MDWYGKIRAETNPENIVLSQGDILKNCPKYVPVKRISSKRILSKALYYDVIVLTQSCDLAKDNVKHTYDIDEVVVCPVTPLNKHLQANIFSFVPVKVTPNKKGEVTPDMVMGSLLGNIKSFKSSLARGHYLKYYLLNKCEDVNFDDYLIVNFNDTFTIDLSSLLKIACDNGERIRLESPYNEGLSQAFGLRYMRVAQPIVIDKETFPKEELASSVLARLENGIPDNLFEPSVQAAKAHFLNILFEQPSKK